MSISSFNESSPLMRPAAIDSPVDVSPQGNVDGRASLHRGLSTSNCLLDSKYTPGLNSQNSALRYLAYSWYITKVTLLSSMFAPVSETPIP